MSRMPMSQYARARTELNLSVPIVALTPPLIALVLLAAVFGHVGNWNGQDSLNRPTHRQSAVERGFTHAQLLTPCSGGFRNAVHCEQSSSSRVAVLLDRRSPSAVVWRVRPTVVDALNGVRRAGFVAHVGNEVVERVTPTIADGDTARAVVSIIASTRVMAAGFNRRPCYELAGLTHAVPYRHKGHFTISRVL